MARGPAFSFTPADAVCVSTVHTHKHTHIAFTYRQTHQNAPRASLYFGPASKQRCVCSHRFGARLLMPPPPQSLPPPVASLASSQLLVESQGCAHTHVCCCWCCTARAIVLGTRTILGHTAQPPPVCVLCRRRDAPLAFVRFFYIVLECVFVCAVCGFRAVTTVVPTVHRRLRVKKK